ncbi:hypothetical protein KR222_006571, partial [Zaprionus bogoriensis]
TFWTCDELQQSLLQVLKLKDVYNLFASPHGSNSIDLARVPECLRAMGAQFVDMAYRNCLAEHLANFPQTKPPTRVSFELVLSLYCELAAAEDVPSVAVMVNGLRSCDTENRGVLPYSMLRRMLTLVGERLNDAEAATLLDSLKDERGNVNYIALMETMFCS